MLFLHSSLSSNENSLRENTFFPFTESVLLPPHLKPPRMEGEDKGGFFLALFPSLHMRQMGGSSQVSLQA